METPVPTIGKARGGFTLLEIVLSLLVVSVGVVASIGLLSTSLGTAARAHEDLDVVSFADLVFNYAHAVTNRNELPISGSLRIPDYNEGTAELPLNSLNRFTCMAPGSDGPAERYTVTYRLAISPAPFSERIRQLTLDVWPGYSTNGPPRRFYTEVYDRSGN